MFKINVGVIGGNFGAKVHIPAWQLLSDINIVQELPNINIQLYNRENWLDGLKKSDIISIAVPPIESHNILKESIYHNKHIFCEKPFCDNLKTALEIQSLLNDNIINAINFEMCESNIIKKLKKLIYNKKLGNINYFILTWNTITNTSVHNSWKMNINKGGGLINNFGSHIFNLLEFIFNEKIISLSGIAEPNIKAQIKFKTFNGDINLNSFVGDELKSNFTIIISCDRGDFILQNNSNIMKNFSLSLHNNNGIQYVIDEVNDSLNQDGRIELTSEIMKKLLYGIEMGTQMRPNIDDGVRAQYLSHMLLSTNK